MATCSGWGTIALTNCRANRYEDAAGVEKDCSRTIRTVPLITGVSMSANLTSAAPASLAALYPDHLRVLRTRADEALAASGFESIAIHSGRAWMQFLDDQAYPFKVNPHFKAWIPLTDAADCWILYQPGKPLRLAFLQPIDYWHKPPALPSAYWTDHFQIEVMREPAEALHLA